jgi:succinate-semialdehyde dehydrogenase/glutarate-semialdehyde dehydrogenase
MTFQSVDPTTGEVIARDRTGPLLELGRLLRARKDEYGALMTHEMGKPIAQATGEAEKCAWVCDYYAEHAETMLAPVPAETDASVSYWTHRPLGLVLGIMPWNFPFWQVIRFAAPAITAGNGVLLKHAPSVPGCAIALQDLFNEAGFPDGLFASLFVDLDTTGSLIDDSRVRAVSLTGSVRAGRAVAARAGAAIKKCVLELGGSDPSLVLSDADLDAAVTSCALGRMLNAGQSCVASKRFIVVDEVRDAFEAKLVSEMNEWTLGDPTDPTSTLGPMARVDLRDALHDQVVRTVETGARLVMGGAIPDRPGAWYPATILSDVRPGMAAHDEELFGPVAAIVPVTNEAEAVQVANETSFGLGASVYTADAERGERIAADLLDAGNCFVNGIVKSDPRLPFGGTKESGYGRELSPLGILEFTNTKTVWVK